MENWCYHKPTLMGLAKHVETGDPLPEALFAKLLAAKNYRAASAMLRQLHFATVDLELHSSYVSGGTESVFDVDRRVASRTSILQPILEDRFLCGFSHIFAGGYSAGKWDCYYFFPETPPYFGPRLLLVQVGGGTERRRVRRLRGGGAGRRGRRRRDGAPLRGHRARVRRRPRARRRVRRLPGAAAVHGRAAAPLGAGVEGGGEREGSFREGASAESNHVFEFNQTRASISTCQVLCTGKESNVVIKKPGLVIH